jgi:class 3 adenylate cyclase
VKVHAALETIVLKALSQSLPVELMEKVARKVIPDYDVYTRSGFPANIPMPRADAAKHILTDMIREGLFLKLVEALVDVHANGDMGRELRIQLLDRIIAEVGAQGYIYNRSEGVFVEAAHREKTTGWGTLHEGRTYEFALLRADVVGNSALVRAYSEELIRGAYDRVRELVRGRVEKRNGRVWSWEGDGALAAFYFEGKNIQATLCGMEIIHELYFFNTLLNRLPEPVTVRLAVHAGPCKFQSSGKDPTGETIRKVELLESRFTRPGSLTVSPGVFTDLGGKLSPLFKPVQGPEGSTLYRYSLEWEKK